MFLYNLFALDSTKDVADSSNLRPIEDAVLLFPGTDFQKHYKDCQDHALLDTRGMQDACKCMYNYVIKVGESIEKRFPELEFMVSNTAFLCAVYKHQTSPLQFKDSVRKKDL